MLNKGNLFMKINTQDADQLAMKCSKDWAWLILWHMLTSVFSLQLEMEDEDTIDVFQQQTGGLI